MAQFDQSAQVSIPVYLNASEHQKQWTDSNPVGELCGIALMLFEIQDDKDYIQMSRLGDPMLWIEKVGISSKATFVIPDAEGVSELVLLLSNDRLSANFKLNGKEVAKGYVVHEKGIFRLRLSGDKESDTALVKILDQVNNYLLRLHLREQKKIFIKPGFNQDTLNVICGYDTQFDTDFDVIWLNESLYDRLEIEVVKVYDLLSEIDSLEGSYQEKVENNAMVEHTSRLSTSDSDVMYGSIVILFQVMGGKNYYFLKGEQKYQIAIDYIYQNESSENPNLTIEKLMLRNINSGDFIEMSIMDLTSNHIPILYVDLINSVIMDDYGTWNIVQVFTVLEDIFTIIDLPNEKG